MKSADESFTDIIENLIERSKLTGMNLKPFFGAFKDDPFLSQEILESNRKEINEQLRERFN